jgi:iron complex transport system substrate-binding protein
VIRALALACICALLCACSKPASETTNGDAAARVVTFAPHLAEMMFAIGAGDRLVGVSSWSDYPREVLELPEVGDAFTVDQEQLALLEPDLVLVWESGMPMHMVDELRSRGYRVETIRTRSLADVADAMIRLGELTGQRAGAGKAAEQFTAALEQLSEKYRDAELFDDLDKMAPSVSVEAVLDRDPEVMLAGTNLGDNAFDEWARWPGLAANQYGNQFLLPDETIGRPIPRLVIAGRAVCIALEQARSNRAAKR